MYDMLFGKSLVMVPAPRAAACFRAAHKFLVRKRSEDSGNRQFFSAHALRELAQTTALSYLMHAMHCDIH
jgi:hypothetical protein